MTDGIIQTSHGFFVLRHDTCLSRWADAAGTLELPENLAEINSFAHLMPSGGVVIDAGACLGDHTITYAKLVGSTGQVHAFEPHPLTYEAMTLNLSSYPQVSCYPLALSDFRDVYRLQPVDNIGASYLDANGEIPISCTTLDACLLPVLSRCDLVHLDAEGWEPRILEGGRGLIARFRPAMVIEVCNDHLTRAGSSEHALMVLIDALGYDVHAIPLHVDGALRDVLCLPRVV